MSIKELVLISFTLMNNSWCTQDGYTKEITGPEAVHVLVAIKAKANTDSKSKLNKEMYKSFLDVSAENSCYSCHVFSLLMN